MRSASAPAVWIDFDNSPHVLFFEPVIRELREAGVEVFVTAKPQAQTVELARLRGIDITRVGLPNPTAWLLKVGATLLRTAALGRVVAARGRPRLFLSHGSRSGVLAARALRVPAWTFLDYEHVEARSLLAGTTRFWLPDLLRTAALRDGIRAKARFYPGLKENLYLDQWPIDRARTRAAFGVGAGVRWVVTRPPATSAHYASPVSWRLWEATVRTLLARPGVAVHVTPRSRAQGQQVQQLFSEFSNVTTLSTAVDGPALVASADLVVGGGGTMNREAAVLGTPVWSVFNGPTPHIDDQLAAEQRLIWIRSERDIAAAEGTLWRRPAPRGGADGRRTIVSAVLDALRVC